MILKLTEHETSQNTLVSDTPIAINVELYRQKTPIIIK